LEKLHETLNKKTEAAASALKELLGSIRLEPVMDKEVDLLYGLSSSCEIASPAATQPVKQ
jgi:hypothetical protein